MSKKPQTRRRSRRALHEPRDYLQQAIEHQMAGRLPEAERCCRLALDRQPASTIALHVMGVIAFGQGRTDEAIDYLQRAIAIDPNFRPAYVDLSNMLSAQNRWDEAANLLVRAVALAPDDVLALNNLGVALKRLNRLDEAVTVLRRAVERDPTHLSAWLNLGYSYFLREDFEPAVEAMEHARRLAPDRIEPLRVLSRLYRMQSRIKDAEMIYQRWSELDPADPVPGFMMRALSGDQGLEQAPADYVKTEFDRFADSFDQQLQQLGYRAPQLVAAEFQRRFPHPDGTRSIADLGCGTGLAGPLLRPYAKDLFGIDLSPAMLAKAAERKVYDILIEDELGDFLGQYVGQFDWIVAIDTLNYFGELRPTLQRIFAMLRSPGVLACTFEAADDGETGYRLTTSGRFAHSRQHLQRLLEDVGFEPLEFSLAPLRTEAGSPVLGWVVWAEKSA